jgi:hypothetical protein
MQPITLVNVLFGVLMAGYAIVALYNAIRSQIQIKRNGPLTFFRVGRLSGSYHIKKRAAQPL